MLQKTSLKARTGGQVLVDQLLIHGADTAYCVPGESYLEVLDALHDVQDRFTLINARHEAGAANMAETYGKLTGTPASAWSPAAPGLPRWLWQPVPPSSRRPLSPLGPLSSPIAGPRPPGSAAAPSLSPAPRSPLPRRCPPPRGCLSPIYPWLSSRCSIPARRPLFCWARVLHTRPRIGFSMGGSGRSIPLPTPHCLPRRSLVCPAATATLAPPATAPIVGRVG